jgi:hypothetical protein
MANLLWRAFALALAGTDVILIYQGNTTTGPILERLTGIITTPVVVTSSGKPASHAGLCRSRWPAYRCAAVCSVASGQYLLVVFTSNSDNFSPTGGFSAISSSTPAYLDAPPVLTSTLLHPHAILTLCWLLNLLCCCHHQLQSLLARDP